MPCGFNFDITVACECQNLIFCQAPYLDHLITVYGDNLFIKPHSLCVCVYVIRLEKMPRHFKGVFKSTHNILAYGRRCKTSRSFSNVFQFICSPIYHQCFCLRRSFAVNHCSTHRSNEIVFNLIDSELWTLYVLFASHTNHTIFTMKTFHSG